MIYAHTYAPNAWGDPVLENKQYLQKLQRFSILPSALDFQIKWQPTCTKSIRNKCFVHSISAANKRTKKLMDLKNH